MFTYQYAQPDEYHFSLDSIHLAEFVAARLQSRKDISSLRVLDLCAGCGVVGMELSWYAPALRQIDFIEVQDTYTSFFYQNVKIVNRPELQLRWHLLNYDVLLKKDWQAQYDLIVSNPPYFQPQHGMLSPSEFKNRCRFYLDSTFENYIFSLVNALASGGEAYFLLRSLKQHGHDLFSDVQSLLQKSPVLVEKVTIIRGTNLVLIKKHADSE